ncbi:MAG: PH domain-containing protein [Microbacterium sp.]
MTQPNSLGRPLAPAPGAPDPERRLVRVRRNARRLLWPALVLIAVAGAVGYYLGNLPDPFADWMLLTAAGVVVLLLVVLPYGAWAAHTYTITTRRVIESSGLLARRRQELSHVRGYAIAMRRGPIQRLWRIGTLTLDDGVGGRLVLRDVPDVRLVHEVLVDQVEVNQILAHRDAQASPPLPPEA